MGLFDTVHCEYPLPDPAHQNLEFQTKSLDSVLDYFSITQDGRLLRHARNGWDEDRTGPDIECAIHGDLRIYTSLPREGSQRGRWVEYRIRFTHGRVETVKPVAEGERYIGPDPLLIGWDLPAGEQDLRAHVVVEGKEPTSPGGQELDAEASEPDDPEGSLLYRLQRERPDLEALLKSSSDHWGYEDPIYRFYHQSFKVYGLQHQTQAIVERLQALAPSVPLNPWFLEIVQSGTGKVFQHEDNARWTEATRPILEAFFHARYFLDMAVRYSTLAEPPKTLPSGYAALLHLYGLR